MDHKRLAQTVYIYATFTMPPCLVFWFRRQLVYVRKVTHEASSLSPEVRLGLCSLNIQDCLAARGVMLYT